MDSAKSQELKGKWKQFKGKIRETWGELTGDRLDQYRGQFDQLVGYVQSETGKARGKIRDRVEELAKKVGYEF
ncbi:MAG: CsbD family protein [bacterium]